MILPRLRHAFASFLVALACAAAVPARASTDYTDIWYNPAESGWGVNFAQNDKFIFATFFIYGPGGAPVWYTAQLARTSSDVYSGPVYATSGTWFGAATFPPVPPSAVVTVGDATFTASSDVRGTLRYRIDTVNVTKTIERQTLVPVSVDEVYLGGYVAEYSSCSDRATQRLPVQVDIAQSATPGTVRVDFLTTTNGALFCRMTGTGTQYGKVIRVPAATYTCLGGLDTTAEISTLRPLDDGIELHWRADLGGGCTERGRVAAVKQ
jgi:hypothetical protein